MRTVHFDLESFATSSLHQGHDRPTFLTFNDVELLDSITLDTNDPVPSLFGRTVASNISAVGICAPATISPRTDESFKADDQTVVHLVHRSGSAITLLAHDNSVRTFGPTAEPQQGRVPDACRRVLGLSTAPPTHAMTDFVLSAWLEIITRHALETPTLTWSDIICLHPTHAERPELVTPTTLAEATQKLGTALDWERFRKVIATVGGFPFGASAKETAAWMDAGMFSRWAMEHFPERHDALEVLEAVLGPGTFDRLWATVRFCE